MKSIICQQKGICYICGRYAQTEEHHIFGGPNRKLSEKYGLKVHLCIPHHRTGPDAVHTRKTTAEQLHRVGQRAFEQRWGDRKQFMRVFGKNYLE